MILHCVLTHPSNPNFENIVPEVSARDTASFGTPMSTAAVKSTDTLSRLPAVSVHATSYDLITPAQHGPLWNE